MNFTEIFNAMQSSASVSFNVLMVIALGYMYKDARAREREHLQTVMTIAPLAAKLADTVVVAERLANQVMGRREPT